MGAHRARRQAFSILETLIALTVLVSAFTVFFRLFFLALDYSGRADQKAVAANVARRQLASLRAWAATETASGYNFDDWSRYRDVTFPDQQYPDYKVRIQSKFVPLTSPCSGLMIGYPSTSIKLMESTYRKVEITVSWSHGSFSVVSLIADPLRHLRPKTPVVVSGGGGGAVPANGTVPFTVKVLDDHGHVIPDVMARWYVQPITGDGTIAANDADGQSATFTNIYNGHLFGGSCQVRARVVYGGQTFWGDSSSMVLAP